MSWTHPWLRLELATRLIIAERLEEGANRERDQTLMLLIKKREEIERAGWFN